MRKLYPDMVFAALASSAVTQAIVDYSAYWEPIRENAPPDCVATVIDTVQIVDDLLGVGDVKVTAEVKRAFGLSGITDDRDFVNLLTLPLGYFQVRDAPWSEMGLDACTGPELGCRSQQRSLPRLLHSTRQS
jgi:hypothetical protein